MGEIGCFRGLAPKTSNFAIFSPFPAGREAGGMGEIPTTVHCTDTKQNWFFFVCFVVYRNSLWRISNYLAIAVFV
jgi:hypothetical protein